MQSRTILISGASGFIGSLLATALRADGHRIVALARSRSGARRSPDAVSWDSVQGRIDEESLRRVAPDVVINLAGERVDQRWTRANRERIRASRVDGTRTLVQALTRLDRKPAVLVNASAVGVYGAHRGDEVLTERSTLGDDFLARVARDWEQEASAAAPSGIRVVCLRTGVVLGPGGALARLRLVFQLGVGGRLGSGEQWMSWIAHDELPFVVRQIIATDSLTGAVNVVAPAPARNAEFTSVLARVLHRPAFVPVPALALQLLYGQMATDTILGSQRAEPDALQRSGYSFRYATLAGALEHQLAR